MAALLFVGLVVVIATVWKGVKNEFGRADAEEGRSVVSRSLSEAKRDGVLIDALSVQPAEFEFEGTTVGVQEAWVERYAVHRFPLVWFHRREATAGYVVAMRPAAFVPELTLWSERSELRSFARRVWPGGMLYSYYSEEEPKFPMTLLASRGGDKIPILVLNVDPTAPTEAKPKGKAKPKGSMINH